MELRVWCLRKRHGLSADWVKVGREVKDGGQTGSYHFLRRGDDFWVFVYGGPEFLLDIANKDGRVSFE